MPETLEAGPFSDLIPPRDLIGGKYGAPAYQRDAAGNLSEVPKAQLNTLPVPGAGNMFADLIPNTNSASNSNELVSGPFDDLVPKPQTETEKALAETPLFDEPPLTVVDKAVGKGLNYARNVAIEALTTISPEMSGRVFGRTTSSLRKEEIAPPIISPENATAIVGQLPAWAGGNTPMGQGLAEGMAGALSSFSTPGQLAVLPAFAIPGFAEMYVLEVLHDLPDQGKQLWGAIQKYGLNSKEVGSLAAQYGITDLTAFLAGKGSTPARFRTTQRNINAAPTRPASEPEAASAPERGPAPETPPAVEPAQSQGAFVPSSEWQEIPKGVPIPDGGRRIVDANTGKTYAKWDNPPEARPEQRMASPEELPRTEPEPGSAANAAAESGLPEGFVSLGASTGADIPAPKVTAIKNSAVDKQRAERGELPLMEPARKSNPETWDEAMERVEKDPEHASKIVDAIRDGTKKEIDAADQMAILHEEIRLRNERTMEADRAADPYTTPEERAAASEQFDKLSERINEVELAGHDAGTMSGRALQIRQQMIRDDYTPAGIERRMAAKKGAPLTPEEVATAKTDSERITKEVAAFEQRVEKVKTEKVAADAGAELKDMAKKSPRKPQPPKENATEVAGIVDGILAAVNEGVTVGQLSNFIKQLAKKFVEGGMRGLDNVTTAIKEVLEPITPEITSRHIHDAFSDYGQSKPAATEPAKVHLSQIRGEAQKTSALQDIIEKQKAPLATGPQRVPQSEIARRLTKLINEAKKRFNIQPTDPARALKTALESRKTYYTNKLADLRFEIAKGERIIKEKSLPPTDPALEALKAEYGRLKSEHLEIFGKREMTPEQRLKSAIAVAERAELEAIKRLENAQKGIFGTTKVPSKVPPSAQLDAIRARTEAIREQVKELHDLANPKKTPEERALQSYKAKLKTMEAELLEKNLRADAGDASVFEKKTRTPLDISKDPQAMALKATVEKSKQELAKKANAYALAHRTLWKKIKDGILMSYDASTNLLSAFDLSAPRQAAFGLASNAAEILSHPRLVVRPFKEMFQVLTSDARSRRFEQERLNRPNALNGVDRQAKVEYTALDETKFSKKEENARSVLDEWAQLPLRTGNAAKTAVTLGPKILSRGVHISNRAFNVFLNTMRSDLLDHLLAINFRDRAPTKIELEAIGNIVNVSTGRGKLRPATTEVAGRILWSPKLLASRIQILAGQPFYRGSARTRKIVAKQYAKAIATGMAVWKVQQLFSDRNEDDSRSSDFGKIVDGATRLDIWGGLQQVLVQEERQRTGQTKTAGGKVLNLRDKSEDTILSTPLSGDTRTKTSKQTYGQGQIKTAADFLRTKLRPQLGAFVNWATGKNIIGEKTTAASVAKDLTVSLAWKDIVELLEEQGMTKGAAYQAAQIFGVGVSTYSTDEKETSEPASMPSGKAKKTRSIY